MANTTKTLQCPVCHQALRMNQFNKLEVDVCPGCNGIWFDYAEMRAIVDSDSFENIDRAFEGTYQAVPVNEAMQGAERHCPRDGSTLKRHEWWGDSGLVMDTCSECGGVWLDEGELEGYVAFIKDWQANPATLSEEDKAELQRIREATEAEIEEYKRSNGFLKLLGTTFASMFGRSA